MIKVTKHGIILLKSSLNFENAGVLNPAVIYEDNIIHMFYRAVRKGNYSTIGYCRLDSPLHVVERFEVPVLFPEEDYEMHGVEDPRISKIDDLYYLTYTVYDGINALGAYATTKTLPYFEKKGILSAQIIYDNFKLLAESKQSLNEKYARFNAHHVSGYHDIQDKNIILVADKKVLLWDKNVVFFPRRINGKICFLHRIKPDIQIVQVDKMEDLTPAFWQDYFLHFYDHIVLSPMCVHEISYIGGGCPPIETEKGWLVIYHGVHDTTTGYRYVACAALLDLENPAKEIARLPYELFSPEHDYELNGEVNNVCFPTGTALFDDTLYIYYGAADEQIACASVSLTALLLELITSTVCPMPTDI